MNNKIEEGDYVQVRFKDSSRNFHGKVLYTPCATGDSWRIAPTTGPDYEKGLVYVQEFETMVLTTKGNGK